MLDAAKLGGTESGASECRAVTVLVVDDQDRFRRAMRHLIAATEGFVLVGEAASGEEALHAVSVLSPRIVIMDKRMPGLGGIESSRVLAASHPGLVILLVSVEEPDANVARSCGAALFVAKRDLSTQLLRELWREHGAA